MPTGLTFLGTQTLGQCLPIGLAASASLKAMIAVQLPKLTAQFAGLLTLSASLTIKPPTLAINLDIAAKLLLSIQASISLGLPGIDFQFAAVASLMAAIQLDLGAFQAALAFQLSLDLALGTAGIDLYAYDGRVDALGTSISSQTAGGLPGGTLPAGHCNALLLVAETDAVWSAMSLVFQTG